MQNNIQLKYDSSKYEFTGVGDWTIQNIPLLEQSLAKAKPPLDKKLTFNGAEIDRFDTGGAWFLANFEKRVKEKGGTLSLVGFSKVHLDLLALVQEQLGKEKKSLARVELTWLPKLGYYVTQQYNDFIAYLSFIGYLTYELLRLIAKPLKFRVNALASAIYNNGYLALPIIAILSVMIGVVIAFQMGLQLRSYGADIYIVDLLGVSMLREFAPLLTAIIISGRTGSSFTAQLGIMKINEEMDALTTMGITPAEILLIPRIMGCVIILPLLTIWSDFFGVFGGMVMANSMLNVTWYDFLQRFGNVIALKNLIIGLGKAPIFGLLIATIGCYEGMRVQNNANSLGVNTTRSVVWSIFFIIVADAIFSVIFSWLNL